MPDAKYDNPNPHADTRDAHDYTYTEAVQNADARRHAHRYARGVVYFDSDLNPYSVTAGDAAFPSAGDRSAGYGQWGLPLVGWSLALAVLGLAMWAIYFWAASR